MVNTPAAPTMQYPVVGSDNAVLLRGAWTLNALTLEEVFLDNGAVVTFRIQDEAGVDLAGETWPQTAQYVPNSQGDFFCPLRRAIAFEPHVECLMIATVNYGVDAQRTWYIPLHPLPP